VQAQDERLGEGTGPAVESLSISEITESTSSAPGEVQQAFPALWKHVRPTTTDQFAHQAERDFAAILDYYRIRWAYEPTSFPLEWDASGRPNVLFTPDFYLPDHRLYIEMTTMRQSLVTRKNRKLRRLRELYPDIKIKLLYRRDYLQLLDVFLRPRSGNASESIGTIVFDAETIAERVMSLAVEIAANIGKNEDSRLIVLTASKGAERFAADLRVQLAALGVASDWDVARPSRPRSANPTSEVGMSARPKVDLSGRRVLLLTDVVSTGLSMEFLNRWAVGKGVREVAICTLLDRPEARITEVPVRYVAFHAPKELVIGYGLQLRKRFSKLDYIATLNTTAKEG
jgi:hypoxanthine phosphoribosyltransferase